MNSDQRTANDDGVDVTLIRWFLTLTPLERLVALQDFVNDVLSIRNASSELRANSSNSPRTPG